jgi:DNA-binding transcriptional LysR family regulator
MELKQIQYFLAVVDTGSFSEAAQQCFISQSAVSQQIKLLEEELGLKLLDRHNRTFSLTEAGSFFYQKCTVLINDLHSVIQQTREVVYGNKADLRIGYLKCYGGYEFQNALSQFAERHPEVNVNVMNGNHENLYEALRDDMVDVVLNDQRRAFSDDYVNRELIDCNCYIELSVNHPLAKLEKIDISDLKNTTCVLVASRQQQANEKAYYRDIIGFKGNIMFAETLQEARLMVISQKAVLPIEMGNNDIYFDKAITRIPLMKNGSPVTRKYCIFWKKANRNPLINDFADMLDKQFQ